MKGIIFDMDGVLVDTMPFHAEALRIAVKEETGYDIDKRIVHLLEGRPGHDLVKEVFKRKSFISKHIDDTLAEKISKRKKELFKKIQNSQAIEGAKELIEDLGDFNCFKSYS